MKKIFLISALLILSFSANLFALNFHIDSAFSYSRIWTEPDKAPHTMRSNAFGMFLALGMNFHRSFAVSVAADYIGGKFVKDDLDYPFDDSELVVQRYIFSIQYLPYIPALINKRINWFISFGCGYASVEMEQNTTPNPMMIPDMKDSDTGISIGVQTGMIIHAAQNFAPFFKIGWERIFYQDKWKDFENNSIMVNVGVRFSFLRTRRIDNTI